MNAEEIIKFFGMEPLADEGGFYVETYRAKEGIAEGALPERYGGDRCLGTSILYLITPESFSKLHRVKSDEVFHFYFGDAVLMLELLPDGESKVIELGSDIINGEHVQVTVGGGVWQGCVLKDGGKFALMGCTVSPGFEFADYESGDRDKLLAQYRDQQELIKKLTV